MDRRLPRRCWRLLFGRPEHSTSAQQGCVAGNANDRTFLVDLCPVTVCRRAESMLAIVLALPEPGLIPLAQTAALLPIGDQCIIDYTLGWLERNGVTEVRHQAPGSRTLLLHCTRAGTEEEPVPPQPTADPPAAAQSHRRTLLPPLTAAPLPPTPAPPKPPNPAFTPPPPPPPPKPRLRHQVHLVASAQADALTAHLRRAEWAGRGARGGMAVHVIAALGCQTEGEALRLVEEKDLIKEDFVLVSGGVVANADLRPAVQAHLARRAADRQALTTLVMQSAVDGTAAAAAAARQQHNVCLALLDPRTQQLLKLEQADRSSHASLGTHMLGERNCVAVGAA